MAPGAPGGQLGPMSASRHVPHRGRSCLAGRTARLLSHSTAICNSLSRNGLRDGLGLSVVALPLLWEEVRHDSGSSMKHLAVLIAGLAISAAVLEAQGSPSGVPDSHRPPPGMCRIWIDGVPPAHQPAPTDCATAIRKRPMNARVVFGNEPAGAERGFAPAHLAPSPTPAPNPSVAPGNQPSHDDADRAAQQQRVEQDRQRAAQQRADEEKRTRRDPPRTQHETHPNNAPPPHPRAEKSPSRPPGHSFSTHRPR
jgi:hypothetical protein